MVPVRLLLKNFMSYGEDAPPLDLTGMHTLCLSGENGNGKSALLDAITWSLWGESRAGKNKHDDLVRIGADEMSVEFIFEMDGQRYRVLRKRSKRASGNQWELQQDSGGDTWRSLTGNNAGETEKAIQKLLRMSYETFLNSAYLRQGNADQFVKQSAGKRKEILADILDLSRYDRLEAMAREKAREASAEATDLDRDINLIDAELSREPEYLEAVASLEQQHAANLETEESLKRELELVRAQMSKLESDRDLIERLKQHERELDRELKELESDLLALSTEFERWKKLLDQKESISAQYQELQAARLRETELQQRVTTLRRDKDNLARVEREWLAAENQVRRRSDEAVRDLRQAQTHVAELPALRKELAQLRDATSPMKDRELERDLIDRRLQELRDRFGLLDNQNASLTAQIKLLEQRLQDLEQQQGVCMVCNSPLPPDKIAGTRELYREQAGALTAERNKVRADGRAVKTEIAEVEKRRAEVAQELTTLSGLQAKLDLLSKSQIALEDVEKRVPVLQAAVDEIAASLKSGSFAPELCVALEDLRARIPGDEHDESALQTIQQTIRQLTPAERAYLQLDHAEETSKGVQARFAQSERRKAQKLTARRENAEQLVKMESVLADLNEITLKADGLQKQVSVLEMDDRKLQQDLGRYRQLLTVCSERRSQRVEKAQKLAAARKDAEAYDQLTKAFGKKGVQALIIENAIPELEDEANRLLARLTDGDMQVQFQTLREAKTKRDTPIETLEIQVHDNLGTRPLEMYSGGEGFRACFAIRIALSKLLARRAGARLQTLIIDEGFGTQDGKGREKLVDVLNALKSDFDRVIVITHIDELKDAFATRVEIVKTPLGSQITVLEGSNG